MAQNDDDNEMKYPPHVINSMIDIHIKVEPTQDEEQATASTTIKMPIKDDYLFASSVASIKVECMQGNDGQVATIKLEPIEVDDQFSTPCVAEQSTEIAYNEDRDGFEEKVNIQSLPTPEEAVSYQSILDSHAKKRTKRMKKGPIQCPQCTFRSVEIRDLRRHLDTHLPPEKRPIKCKLCKYTCTRQMHLDGHMAQKHGDTTKLLKCEHCAYTTTYRFSLKSHVLKRHCASVKTEKPFSCHYRDCNYKCAYKKYLIPHFAHKHGETQHLKNCPHCSYSSAYAADLTKHMDTHLPKSRRFIKCHYPDCPYSSSARNQFNAHLATQHGETDHLRKCPHCDHLTVRSDHMKLHVMSHFEKKRFKCDFPDCGYACGERIHLNSHLLKKHGQNVPCHKCPQCDFMTVYGKDLKRHLETHLPDKMKSFKCQHLNCGYCVATKHSLLGHLANVHGETANLKSCPDCDYVTVNSHHLARHMKTHLKQEGKGFVCGASGCPYRTTELRLLNAHFSKKHL